MFFTYVSDSKLLVYVRSIAEAEGLSISDDGIDALAYYSRGNMTKALLTMQLASLEADGAEIEQQDIYEAMLSKTPEDITHLFEAALAGDIMAARKVIDKLLIENGLSGSEILEQLYDVVVASNEPEMNIARFVKKIADTDLRLIDAANDRIQLETLVSNFC